MLTHCMHWTVSIKFMCTVKPESLNSLVKWKILQWYPSKHREHYAYILMTLITQISEERKCSKLALFR